MALYDYPRDKNPDSDLSPYMRRPFGTFDPTVAMHWDGTYRDRVRDTQDNPQYWFDDESDMVAQAKNFAKHLA